MTDHLALRDAREDDAHALAHILCLAHTIGCKQLGP